MSKHRINRAEIELVTDELALGKQVIERVSQLRDRRIAPLLERVCSELSGPDHLDRIGKLELDLGIIEARDFDDNFLSKLEDALRAALSEQLLARPSRERPRSGRAADALACGHDERAVDDGAVRASDPSPEQASAPAPVSVPGPVLERAIELLDIFLLTGNLPWWVDRDQPALIATQVQRVLRAAPHLLVRLVKAHGDDAAALARLARHCDHDGFADLLGRLYTGDAHGQSVVLGRTRELAAFLGRTPADSGPRTHLARVRGAVLAALVGSDAHHPDQIIRSALQVLTGSRARPLQLPVAGGDATGTPAWLRELVTAAGPGPTSRDVPARAPETAASPPALRPQWHWDELYVDDAGLVILWPFFEHFFIYTGLLDDQREFVDQPARMQAIALLAQLGLADSEPPEYHLALAKLLCGLAPEAEFSLERPLCDHQLDECERLLRAVIDRSSILDASDEHALASFRASFLRRPGVLSIRDGAWHLQVERRAHDLVLDRFPWAWSWLRLPWMPDPLQVAW